MSRLGIAIAALSLLAVSVTAVAGSGSAGVATGLAMVDEYLGALRAEGTPADSERIKLLEMQRQQILESVEQISTDVGIAAADLGSEPSGTAQWDTGEVECEAMQPFTDALSNEETLRCLVIPRTDKSHLMVYLTVSGRALAIRIPAEGQPQTESVSIPKLPSLATANLQLDGDGTIHVADIALSTSGWLVGP